MLTNALPEMTNPVVIQALDQVSHEFFTTRSSRTDRMSFESDDNFILDQSRIWNFTSWSSSILGIYGNAIQYGCRHARNG